MTAVYVCECGHLKTQHIRTRHACRAEGCDCLTFGADLRASAAAQGVELAQGGVVRAPAMPSGGDLAAQLRRVEQQLRLARIEVEQRGSAINELAALYESATAETARVRAAFDVAEELRLKTVAERDELSRKWHAALEEGDRLFVRLLAAGKDLPEVHALVEKIPGRTPVEVLRQCIADGQDARIEVARLRGQLVDVRAAAAEKVRAVLEAAATTNNEETPMPTTADGGPITPDDEIEIKATTVGTCTFRVNRAEYEQALADGEVDDLFDVYVSDMDEETTYNTPDGRVHAYPSGEVVGDESEPF